MSALALEELARDLSAAERAPTRRREPKWIMTDDGQWASRVHVRERDGKGGWIEFPEDEVGDER